MHNLSWILIVLSRGWCILGAMENNKTNKTKREPFYADAKAEFGPTHQRFAQRKKKEAQLLCNQEVRINTGQFSGKTAFVRKVAADGRSLEVEIAHTSGKIAFVDVTFVSEIQERTQYAKGEPNLGPIANGVVRDTV